MAVGAAAAAPVTAQVVGNAFVQQYYHILHHSPASVYRFYQDASTVGRPEEDGSMSITTTMQAINDKIVSLNYGDFIAEIQSVDSQDSFNDGVHVLVIGYLTGKDNKASNFAQTFFLAPQDKGYFVLNDIFRYVNVAPSPPLVSDVAVPNAAEPVPAPVQVNHVPEQSTPSEEKAVSREMKQSKRKKKSRAVGKGNEAVGKRNAENHGEKAVGDEEADLKNLLEAFGSVSVEEAASAYREAGRDADKAAEILSRRGVMEDFSTTSLTSSVNNDVGSSSSSSSTASDVCGIATNFLQDDFKPRMKKVVASAGTVSTLLGKDYVRSIPKEGSSKSSGFEQSWSKEEAEQFLCQCGYNLDKALDVLLELSASSVKQPNGYYESSDKEDSQYHLNQAVLFDRTSDSTSHTSDVELQENVWFSGNPFRNDSKISESSRSHHSTETGNMESELPQKVLESLFNMPTPKAAEKESDTMNWRNIVKKITSHGQSSENGGREQGQLVHADGDEYQVLREPSHQHYDSMKSYYQKAVTAFSNGETEYASCLSEKGRLQKKMAREAGEKASKGIFAARNKNIKNMITIDLHGQHIKQAMKFLKIHLHFGACIQSVRSFMVITGYGSHGVGSKLKNSVVNLLQKEGIKFSEENRGALLIQLNGQTNFSFLDSGSDSE